MNFKQVASALLMSGLTGCFEPISSKLVDEGHPLPAVLNRTNDNGDRFQVTVLSPTFARVHADINGNRIHFNGTYRTDSRIFADANSLGGATLDGLVLVDGFATVPPTRPQLLPMILAAGSEAMRQAGPFCSPYTQLVIPYPHF